MPTKPRIRYGVAMSLDGFIAGARGEFDWLLDDPELDFAPIWAQFDTFLMGRRTWEIARLGPENFKGKQIFVASRTLRPEDIEQHTPGAKLIPELTREVLHNLRAKATKDIWLFGGSQLAGAVYALGELDGIDISLIPVVLAGGIPLLPALNGRSKLRLLNHRASPSGILHLEYAVQR